MFYIETVKKVKLGKLNKLVPFFAFVRVKKNDVLK